MKLFPGWCVESPTYVPNGPTTFKESYYKCVYGYIYISSFNFI